MNLNRLIEKSRPHLKASSIENYSRNIKKLNNNEPVEDLDFLKDTDKIKNLIKDYSPTTQRNLITSVIVILKSIDESEKILKIYSEELEALNLIINNKYALKLKSSKEELNWMSLEELKDIQKEYQSQIKIKNIANKNTLNVKDRKLLLNYLIASLYTLQPAIRLEYSSMQIIKSKKEIENNKNYLINIGPNTKYFYLSDFKSIKQQGKQEIKINLKLCKVINLYLKFHESNDFLANSRNEIMSSNSLGKLIKIVFEKNNKIVNLNMIRKAWVDSVVDVDQIEKENKLAQAMLHTPETQKAIYSKHD